MTIVAVCIASIWPYQIYSDWAEKRALKKAEVDEFFRRRNLSSEQRIAEDKASAALKAREESIRKHQEAIKAKEEQLKPFRGACLIALKSSLNDPSSFSFTQDYGDIDETGMYVGYIDGRARNGFGALIAGTWKCTVSAAGPNVVVNSLEQIKPYVER